MKNKLAKTGVECPKCKSKKSYFNYLTMVFRRPIAEQIVGKCTNKECNYNMTPNMYSKEYLYDSVLKEGLWSCYNFTSNNDDKFSLEASDYWSKSPLSSNLVTFLDSKFEKKDVRNAMRKYKVTSPRFAGDLNVFWQINESKNVVDGRVLEFNEYTGECLSYRKNNDYALISEMGRQTNEYRSYHKKVMFGLHLFSKIHKKPICIVEDEKSAIIGSIVFPYKLWLATCGQSLNFELLKPILGQEVTLMPNNENYDKWEIEARKFGFRHSLLVKKNFSESKGNLADFLMGRLNQLNQ